MLLILTILLFSFASYAGDGLRGGGDIVYCSPSKVNNLQGHYPLGLIQKLATKPTEKPSLLFSSKSCSTTLKQLEANLIKHTPVLAAGFSEFLDSFETRREPSKKVSSATQWKRQWVSCNKKECLNDYYDEGINGFLVFKLPENCQKISQYALRKQKRKNNKTVITYYFNEDAHGKLKGPHCAFNLVHEWLRDFEAESDELYNATYEIFSDHLSEKIKRKEGLYSFLPKELLVPSSKPNAILKYQNLIGGRQHHCPISNLEVCNFKFITIGGSFGFVTKTDKVFWNIIVPKRNKPLEEKKVLKEKLQSVGFSEIEPGFLQYLSTLDLTKWTGKKNEQKTRSRNPAKNN